MAKSDHLTMAEAAKMCRVSYRTMQRAVRAGEIPVRRVVGRSYLLSRGEVGFWMVNRRARKGP